MDKIEALAKVTKARSAMVQHQVFFGVLAMRLEIAITAVTATADVDGTRIRFNPGFVERCTVPELAGIWSHEVLHCATGQVYRQHGRESDLWNLACDAIVNPVVIAAGLTLPRGCYLRPDLATLGADQAYKTLLAERDAQQPPEPEPESEGNDDSGPDDSESSEGGTGDAGSDDGGPAGNPDPGGCGGMRAPTDDAGTSLEQADIADALEDWHVAAMQAASIAAAAGQGAQTCKDLVKAEQAPVIDWCQVLREFFTTASKNDYSMSRPNRRYLAAGYYLPSLHSTTLQNIGVFVDTSGSTWAWRKRFAAELSGIMEDVRPANIHVVMCHKSVHGYQVYTPDDLPLVMDMSETGGTDFKPPFAFMASLGIDLDCAVYLTDLEGYAALFPPEPDYPVLWVSGERQAAPFGTVLKLPRLP
jgi:predicted metal-dependent peptidase